LRTLNNAADGRLQLARRVEIDEKNDPLPSLPFGDYFRNTKCPLNPFVLSFKKVSHQFSSNVQVLTLQRI
jgi:hypothetical protein